MKDCGHLALIVSGEARGLCPLCQRDEIERLWELKTPASRKLVNITKALLDEANTEIDQLTALNTELVAVLQWLQRKGSLGLDVHERIRAAIAKAEGKHECL